MSRLAEQALHARAGSLRGFAAHPIGTGQMCQSYRIALDWAAPQGPASIVAKCPASDPGTRAIAAAVRCYTLELSWYRELATQIPVACPKCLHLESANNDQDFALLLEDLSPARQGDQLAAATIPQIEIAIQQAALLHAPFWGSERLNDIAWLKADEATGALVRAQLPILFAAFRERYAGRLAPDILDMGADFVSRIDRYQEMAPAAPTIQHRDFRIDNLLFTPVPIVVHGLENLTPAKPCVLVSNHASYLDGIMLVAALPGSLSSSGYFSFVAKRELVNNIAARIYLQRIGTDFVERFDAQRSVEDAKQVAY